MSGSDLFILWGMFMIGMSGTLVFIPEDTPRPVRLAGAAWIAVWCGPPLVRLWIAGVAA